VAEVEEAGFAGQADGGGASPAYSGGRINVEDVVGKPRDRLSCRQTSPWKTIRDDDQQVRIPGAGAHSLHARRKGAGCSETPQGGGHMGKGV
jgi:hypothetical protein